MLDHTSHQRDNSEIVMAIGAAIAYYEQFPYRPSPKKILNNLKIVLELEDWVPGGGTGNVYYDWLKKIDEERKD